MQFETTDYTPIYHTGNTRHFEKDYINNYIVNNYIEI